MTALRDLHKDDKPREKLLNKGVEALKNDELLAILLGSGVCGRMMCCRNYDINIY